MVITAFDGQSLAMQLKKMIRRIDDEAEAMYSTTWSFNMGFLSKADPINLLNRYLFFLDKNLGHLCSLFELYTFNNRRLNLPLIGVKCELSCRNPSTIPTPLVQVCSLS